MAKKAETLENEVLENEVLENEAEAEAKAETKAETKAGAKAEAKAEVKKYLVETPVKDFCGIVAGVHFAKGKAEVYEGHILNWFKKKGYKVTAL